MKRVNTDIYFGLQGLILHGELSLLFSKLEDFFFEFANVTLCALPMSAIQKPLAQPRWQEKGIGITVGPVEPAHGAL